MLIRLLPLLVLLVACEGRERPGPSSPGAPDAGAPAIDAATPSTTTDAGPVPDAAPDRDSGDTLSERCAGFIGAGDGCDCGCGVYDPDCPADTSVSDCDYEYCSPEGEVDPEDPSRCRPVALPDGWTCSAALYGDGYCSCGCGAHDDADCPATIAQSDCDNAGCADGFAPDPVDPRECTALPSGWTCSWSRYYDTDCDCGCGIADPSCPSAAHVSDCEDACPSGESPDPTDLTRCIRGAPQDRWTCDLTTILDGSCDCGCDAVDPDCPPGATAASCDTIHCGSAEELETGSISECWARCDGSAPAGSGRATCTNGGMFSVGTDCVRTLSRCTDGNRYEMECTGGDCLCKINGACVGRATGGCSFSSCGWFLVDDT